jgi:hypothetical protein
MLPPNCRQQLYNDQLLGRITEVQFPRERITTLHGIMIDLDPKLFRPGNSYLPPRDDPREFLAGIRPVLDRHPLARQAEVRLSGTGLHVIVRLDPPAKFFTASQQRRWDHIVRAVQYSFPGDPNAPGITAVTRALGSVNTKNQSTVELLHPGRPVTPGAVEDFVSRLGQAPFSQFAALLLGSCRVSPCPLCRGEGSRLDALDEHGMCYAHCGRVGPDKLLELVYATAEPRVSDRSAADAGPKGKRRGQGRPAGPALAEEDRSDSLARSA